MKTTKRFEEAVEKLYKAFNEGTLNAFDCTACAVGNMCGTTKETMWVMHDADGNSYKGWSMYNPPKHKYYSEDELFNVEAVFLECFEGNYLKSAFNKENQFNGLMAVINYLAELDGIDTIDSQYNRFKEVLTREQEVILN